jgi:type IV pilus assembly protein PilZ
MEEKRTSPRIATNVEIVFREAGSFIKSYMLNVSNGGIFIKTDHPLPLDSVLALRIQLPDDKEKMDITGRVVLTNSKGKAFPLGMGIQFTAVAPAHKDRIAAFVAANLVQIQKLSLL